MAVLDTMRRVAHDDLAEVTALLARAHQADGHIALNDHLMVDLHHGHRPDMVAVLARRDDAARGLLAYGQASLVGEAWMVGLVVDPDHRHDATRLGTAVMHEVMEAVGHRGGGLVKWWVLGPTDQHEAIARSIGLGAERELLQMRRDLPTGMPVDLPTRGFVVGQDEGAWLDVNNRAFSWHDEQGGWDLPTLQSREAEAWFDPEGFLLHERDGRLAGFCWTKVHEDEDPPLGEIYVIAVDPHFQGLGLGRDLTLAGLQSMADRGLSCGMLFVDARNTPAVELYRSLGFVIHRRDRAFTNQLPAHEHLLHPHPTPASGPAGHRTGGQPT